MKRRLKVAMIGYNFMGKAHSNAWREASRFFDLPAEIDLHTICGRNRTHLDAAAAQLGWSNVVEDWREAVANSDIDIVDICTPTESHHPIALAAMAHGKAVLCEKPLAMDVAQCEDLVEAASARV